MIEFDWLIHYRCNYKCYYCFFAEHWDYVEKKNVKIPYIQWVEAWKRLHKKYGDIKIIITGGEPMIFPHFHELLVELNKFAEVSFDTNLSYSKEKLEKLVSQLDCSKLFIGASYHPIFAELKDFFEKMMVLKKYNVNCRVHYVTHPRQLELMPKVKELFVSKDIRFTPIPFRGIYNGKKYPGAFTKEEEEIIYGVTKNIVEIDQKWADVQVEQTDSKDKLCRAGQHYARVDCDGSVYPCAHDFKETGGNYLLGNILDENFSMNTEPMICRHEKCPCEFRWIVHEK